MAGTLEEMIMGNSLIEVPVDVFGYDFMLLKTRFSSFWVERDSIYTTISPEE